jgi:nucleotide-binding universal stress UspA family protein
MLENILVPLDGSDLADRALPYATALARASGGTLMLVQAVDAMAVRPRQAEEPDLLARLQTATSALRAGGVQAEPYLCHLYMEEVGAGIVRTGRERGADLIVMSTHGRSGLGRWIYGSVADAVLREAEVPVVLIPAACQHRWPTDRKPRILVPLDGSNLATQALGPTWLICWGPSCCCCKPSHPFRTSKAITMW